MDISIKWLDFSPEFIIQPHSRYLWKSSSPIMTTDPDFYDINAVHNLTYYVETLQFAR